MYGGHLGLLAFSEWAGDCVRDKRQALQSEREGASLLLGAGRWAWVWARDVVWCEGKRRAGAAGLA